MKVITIIFLIILLAGAAYASPDITINKYSTGFSLSPYDLDQTTCSCDDLQDSYFIQNTAAYEMEFFVSNSIGLNQNFKKITLKPNQKAILVISAELLCNADDIIYKLTVSSSNGQIQTLNRNVIVEQCQNLGLSMNGTDSILPNSTLTKKLQIINSGSFTETYQVSSKRLNGFVKNESYLVTILPYSSETVDFVYDFGPDFYGNYTLKFEAKAIKNKLTASVEDDFEILRDYDFTANSDEITVCTELNEEFTFSIFNEGAITNYFYIQILNGRDYKILNDHVEILSGKSAEIKIKPNKNSFAEEILRIKITAEFGGNGAVLEIPVTALNCYNNNYVVPEEIKQCGEGKEYSVIINNDGLLDSTNYIWASQGKLSEKVVTLEPGESEEINFEIETAEGNTILVFGSEQGNKTFNIPTTIAEKCVIPSLIKDSFETTNSFAQMLIPIRNVGFEDAEFEVSIDNDAILDNDKLFIASGETVNLLVNVDLSSRDFGTYGFNILMESDESENFLQIVLNYKDKSFFQKAFDFAYNNPCLYVLGGMTIIAAIFLLMWIFVSPKGKGSKQVAGIILFVILLVSALLIIGLKGAPEPINPKLAYEPAELYFETYVGDSLIIDLSQFFEDEDNDNLTYSLGGDDIFLIYQQFDDTLVLNPPEGVYELYFLATDGDEEVSSPGALIVSKPKTQISFIGFITRYACWLSWMILVIASIFFFGFISKRSKKPKKGDFEKPKFSEKKKATKNSAKKKSAKKTAAKKSAKKSVEKLDEKKLEKEEVKKAKKSVEEPKTEHVVEEPEFISTKSEVKKKSAKKAVKKKPAKKKTTKKSAKKKSPRKTIVLEEKSVV